MHGQRGQFHVGRHPDHTGQRLQALLQGLSPSADRPLVDHVRLGAECQQPVPQLALEAVHDRQDHDQRRNPQRHPGERHPGDQRDEKFVLPRAHIAQADEQGQRLKHGGHLSTRHQETGPGSQKWAGPGRRVRAVSMASAIL